MEEEKPEEEKNEWLDAINNFIHKIDNPPELFSEMIARNNQVINFLKPGILKPKIQSSKSRKQSKKKADVEEGNKVKIQPLKFIFKREFEYLAKAIDEIIAKKQFIQNKKWISTKRMLSALFRYLKEHKLEPLKSIEDKQVAIIFEAHFYVKKAKDLIYDQRPNKNFEFWLENLPIK